MKLPIVVSDDHVEIERLVPGGQGLATNREGIKGFFWNALPGETVLEYEITKKKSHYFEAIALKIDSPSTHRIAPKDSCYLSTSPWQIFDYDYELAQKQQILTEILKQNQLFDLYDITSPIMGDTHDFFYRNKMEYSLYYDYTDEKLHLGFHQRGTHRKIKVETSSIERPEIFKKAIGIIDELNTNHVDGRRYQSLLLRCNQNGEVAGGLYENHHPHPIFENLTDQILGRTYSYSPNGFFQINLPVYEMALAEIQKHVETTEVLDLYAGVGTIGLSVANDKHLTLVEVDKNSFAELKNNVGNHSAVLAKAEEVTDFIQPDQTVIVDPPRAGLDPKLIERLLEITPNAIIYLSCNPVTQARDLKLLCTKYQIEKIQAFNFFPHTPHLENLVILKPSKKRS
ncbi:class I SAM-dependent RNA methyltransferase [Candidatus Saccharibacteria bacterium]|nr:class I SAM-dependent RNA methyltransferase [Candidatus Saccharibacteria bacterium]